jgi:NADH dehydrogenase [ubiquinone] 1 alpha subcomplex assembly factor 7
MAETTSFGQLTGLEDRLARIIARQGPIRLADFMAAAIEDYYAHHDPFGAKGDFITAPEISSVFGELIGLWLVASWRLMGAPDPILTIELGPGEGRLLQDALHAARIDPAFIKAVQIHLVEQSLRLAAIQQKIWPQATGHRRIDTVPDGPCLIIANEFFDCLAVRQFEKTAQGWQERYVTHVDGAFALCLCYGPSQDHWIPPNLRDAPDGSVFEVSPQSQALAQELALRVKAGTGAALIIDYGAPSQKLGASIQAIKDHQVHPVLVAPGSADVTAHVDFTALAEASRNHARIFGPVSQGAFLTRLGIYERAAQIARSHPAQAAMLNQAIDRLTGANQMGGLFQVLSIANLPDDSCLPGFDSDPD